MGCLWVWEEFGVDWKSPKYGTRWARPKSLEWADRWDGRTGKAWRFVILLSCFSPLFPLKSFSKPIETNYLQKKFGLIKRRKAVKKGGNLHFPTLQGLMVRSFSVSSASLEL